MIFIGEEKLCLQIYAELEKNMYLKKRALLGFEPEDDKTITILNRLITVETSGVRRILYEPDPRHAEILIKGNGLITSKNRSRAVTSPGEKGGDYYDVREIEGEQATVYRSQTMRLSFLAQDLPHLQFAANKTAKFMSKPCVGGANRLKRVARFLLGHPRWAIVCYELMR